MNNINPLKYCMKLGLLGCLHREYFRTLLTLYGFEVNDVDNIYVDNKLVGSFRIDRGRVCITYINENENICFKSFDDKSVGSLDDILDYFFKYLSADEIFHLREIVDYKITSLSKVEVKTNATLWDFLRVMISVDEIYANDITYVMLDTNGTALDIDPFYKYLKYAYTICENYLSSLELSKRGMLSSSGENIDKN